MMPDQPCSRDAPWGERRGRGRAPRRASPLRASVEVSLAGAGRRELGLHDGQPLGSAIERSAAVGEAELPEAADAYRAVARHAGDLSVEVAAHARVNLLVAELQLIARAEEEEEEEEQVPPALRDSLVALADVARLVTDDDAVSSVVRGRALRRLG